MAKSELTEVRARNRRIVTQEQSRLMIWMRRVTTTSEADIKVHVGRYGEASFDAGLEIGRAEARLTATEVYSTNKLLKGMVVCFGLVIIGLLCLVGWLVSR